MSKLFVTSQIDFSHIEASVFQEFQNYCEKHEWTPVFKFLADEVEISFISPQPEVEHIVRGLTLEMALKRAIQ